MKSHILILPGQSFGRMHSPFGLDKRYEGLHRHPLGSHFLLQFPSFGDLQVAGQAVGQSTYDAF